MPRCVGPTGGTSTLGDCVVAFRYIVWPWRLIRGPAIREYEAAFARVIGVRYANSFWAGRVGLFALLRALGVGPGDEVLLQVPTHIVVSNAILYTGARPIYVDCELDTFNMDLDEAERQITPRTKVLILQHTYGNPVDMDKALALAARHRLTIIEDCVHALGATYRGKPVGSFGRAAFFSTEETKTISSTMGGVVATNDAELAARVLAFQEACALPTARKTIRYLAKFIAYHALMQPYVHRLSRVLYELSGKRHGLPRATSGEESRGERPRWYERRFSNAQAVLALRQLQRLDANVRHRRAVCEAYVARLADWGFKLPQTAAEAEPAYVRFPLWVEDRLTAERKAKPRVLLGNWFTSVLEEAESPIHGGYAAGSCPRAEAAAQHVVNLPTNPRVAAADIEAVLGVFAELASPRDPT